MWVARDKDGTLKMWTKKPCERFIQTNGEGYWNYFALTKDGYDYGEEGVEIIIPDEYNLFPNLKWEDDPIEVSILSTTELNSLKTELNNFKTSYSSRYEDHDVY